MTYDDHTLLAHDVRYGGYLACASAGLPELDTMLGALEAFANPKVAPRSARSWKQALSAMLDAADNLVFYDDEVRMLRFAVSTIAMTYHHDTQVLLATPHQAIDNTYSLHRIIFRDPKSARTFNQTVNMAAHRGQPTAPSSPPRTRSTSIFKRLRLKSVSRSCEALNVAVDEPLYDTRTLVGLSSPRQSPLAKDQSASRDSMDSGCFELETPVPRAGALSRTHSIPTPSAKVTPTSSSPMASALAALPSSTTVSMDDLRTASDNLDVNVLMLDHEDGLAAEPELWSHHVDWQEAQTILADMPVGAFLLRTDGQEHVLSLKRAHGVKASHVPIIKTVHGYHVSGCKALVAATPLQLVMQLSRSCVRIMGTALGKPVENTNA
eukprot:m.47035 g.47035  ORF g.47035 m.47035 type:complete len:380 (-) comp13194_c0_seq1:75-1214(-)